MVPDAQAQKADRMVVLVTTETNLSIYRILLCGVRFSLKCLGVLLGIGASLFLGFILLLVVLYCALMERPRTDPFETLGGSAEPCRVHMYPVKINLLSRHRAYSARSKIISFSLMTTKDDFTVGDADARPF